MKHTILLIIMFFHLTCLGISVVLVGAENENIHIQSEGDGRYLMLQDMTKEAFEYLNTREKLNGIVYQPAMMPIPLEIGEEGYRYFSQLTRLEYLTLGMMQNSCDLNDKHLRILQNLTNLRAFSPCANRISDEGFKMFAAFPHLQGLFIPKCEISDTGLRNLTELENLQENLRYLGISNCPNITDTGLAFLASLRQLEDLRIGGCGISGKGLKGLEQITRIVAWRTSMNDVGLRSITTLKNLRELDLAFCEKITDSGLRELSALTQLEVLRLDDCPNITDAGLRYLASLKNLRKLELVNCSITDSGLQELASLENLHELNLGECKHITGAGFKKLSSLTQLEDLNLYDCPKITDSGLRSIGVLKNLRKLSLGNCEHITNSGLQGLTSLERLEDLDVSNCPKITDSGLQTLVLLKRLEFLDVTGCSEITKKGMKKFQKKLPECEVDFDF